MEVSSSLRVSAHGPIRSSCGLRPRYDFPRRGPARDLEPVFEAALFASWKRGPRAEFGERLGALCNFNVALADDLSEDPWQPG